VDIAMMTKLELDQKRQYGSKADQPWLDTIDALAEALEHTLNHAWLFTECPHCTAAHALLRTVRGS
jgi:hypothetical protein